MSRLAQKRYVSGGKLTLWDDATLPRPRARLGSGGAPIVPAISSGVGGPLELVHLPRMWLEGLLAATGRLHAQFAGGRPLFDEILCATIKLDRRAFASFLRTVPLPDYPACERWVRAHARLLDATAIALVNNAIRKASEDGMTLVLRDDVRAWDALRTDVLLRRDEPLEPIVPLVSSRTAGALGVDHLPRFWLKNILMLAGALPVGYRAGSMRVLECGLAAVSSGLDEFTFASIGIDMAAVATFIAETVPDERSFELWVGERATGLDAASVAWHNAARYDPSPPKTAAEKAYIGSDATSGWGYMLNDLIDWRLLYEIVTGNALPAWTGPR